MKALECVKNVVEGEISAFNFHTLKKEETRKVLEIVEHSLMWMKVDSPSTKRLSELKKELEDAFSLSQLYF